VTAGRLVGAEGGTRLIPPLAAVALATALVLATGARGGGQPAGAGSDARVLAAPPLTLDPARAGDAGSSAVIAQLFETLTTVDASLTLRPALADWWTVDPGGRRVTFHLRSGIRFSDGSPITSRDVVESWLRLLDPAHPSPLASLLEEVSGATEFLHGQLTDPRQVGLSAEGDRVVVSLQRPAADFPAIVASPSLAVLPPVARSAGVDAMEISQWVGSGAYLLAGRDGGELTLTANPDYWAGVPAIGTVHLVTDLGGRNPVAAFLAEDLDYADIPGDEASWIRYDPQLGPQLRAVPSLFVLYLGFDTRRPPFSDPRVRRAFAAAVDWRRIVALASDGTTVPADGMVPPGIPGRPEGDFVPPFNPGAAQELLTAAGYPGGLGFPPVTLVSSGSGLEGGIVAALQTGLKIQLGFEAMDFDQYLRRLDEDPPPLWILGWSADYPGPNDFLGVLLGTGSSANAGGWSSPAFDQAVAEGLAATDPLTARSAFARAEAILRDQVPVVPLAYGSGFALARTGLLGAQENGLGILRLAGLAWKAP
jgi:oligopeptide transport system substrate-binding protein